MEFNVLFVRWCMLNICVHTLCGQQCVYSAVCYLGVSLVMWNIWQSGGFRLDVVESMNLMLSVCFLYVSVFCVYNCFRRRGYCVSKCVSYVCMSRLCSFVMVVCWWVVFLVQICCPGGFFALLTCLPAFGT